MAFRGRVCAAGGRQAELPGAALPTEQKPANGPKRPLWIRHSSLGIELVAAVAGLTALGFWIDRHFDSGPWGLLTGFALGLVGGLYNLIRSSLSAFASREAASPAAEDDRPDERI